jgi:hypothetical protein
MARAAKTAQGIGKMITDLFRVCPRCWTKWPNDKKALWYMDTKPVAVEHRGSSRPYGREHNNCGGVMYEPHRVSGKDYERTFQSKETQNGDQDQHS